MVRVGEGRKDGEGEGRVRERMMRVGEGRKDGEGDHRQGTTLRTFENKRKETYIKSNTRHK